MNVERAHELSGKVAFSTFAAQRQRGASAFESFARLFVGLQFVLFASHFTNDVTPATLDLLGKQRMRGVGRITSDFLFHLQERRKRRTAATVDFEDAKLVLLVVVDRVVAILPQEANNTNTPALATCVRACVRACALTSFRKFRKDSLA